MSIVLQGSTSGSVTLQEPAVAGTTVLDLPAVSGTILTTTSPKAGNVIQVVQTVKSDTFSSTSGSLTEVTGLNVSITPTSSSSKILVSCAVAVGYNNDGTATRRGGITLFRGSTNLLTPTSAGSRTPTFAWATELLSNEAYDIYCFEFLDSPNTISSTNYNIRVINGGAGSSIIYVNRSETDTDQAITGRSVSTITALEIAA
jgi:hypothetical protein